MAEERGGGVERPLIFKLYLDFFIFHLIKVMDLDFSMKSQKIGCSLSRLGRANKRADMRYILCWAFFYSLYLLLARRGRKHFIDQNPGQLPGQQSDASICTVYFEVHTWNTRHMDDCGCVVTLVEQTRNGMFQRKKLNLKKPPLDETKKTTTTERMI